MFAVLFGTTQVVSRYKPGTANDTRSRIISAYLTGGLKAVPFLPRLNQRFNKVSVAVSLRNLYSLLLNEAFTELGWQVGPLGLFL
jgi:hypothetical protein